MLMRAFVALPFHSRQRSRSTLLTITAFAAVRAGSSTCTAATTCVRWFIRIAMWNQSSIGDGVAPASPRIPQSRTAISEGGQERVLGAPNDVEVPTDQRFDVGISSFAVVSIRNTMPALSYILIDALPKRCFTQVPSIRVEN